MKRCPKCGREYSGGISICPNDEETLIPFVPPLTPNKSEDAPAASGTQNKSEVSLRKRLGSLVSAWVVALVASAVAVPSGSPGLALLAFMFPIGWTFFLLGPLGLLKPDYGLYLGSLCGWAVYGALTATALLTNKRRIYVKIFTALCVLLLLNLVGCNLLTHTNIKQ